MTKEECKQYAQDNPEFEDYCNRFCISHAIKKDDGIYAFKMIQIVAEEYKKKQKEGL